MSHGIVERARQGYAALSVAIRSGDFDAYFREYIHPEIEWVPVPDTSPAIGRTLAECAFRARTGITIIAILREPESVVGAQPEDVIERGDTLVTVGKLGQYPAFRKLLAEGPFD